jgi:hypothetical protein
MFMTDSFQSREFQPQLNMVPFLDLELLVPWVSVYDVNQDLASQNLVGT